MNRRLITEQELVVIINAALQGAHLTRAGHSPCGIEHVCRLPEPAADGCNWELPSDAGTGGGLGAAAAVASSLRRVYNLKG